MQLHVDQAATYRIRVQGRLGQDWSDWFSSLAINIEDEHESPVTTLTGRLPDQAALHGLLNQIRDLGLPLLDVHYIEPSPP